MTVGELIEELERHPAHHRVFIEFPDRSEPRVFGYASEIASVGPLRADGDCCVIVDATGGVHG